MKNNCQSKLDLVLKLKPELNAIICEFFVGQNKKNEKTNKFNVGIISGEKCLIHHKMIMTKNAVAI